MPNYKPISGYRKPEIHNGENFCGQIGRLGVLWTEKTCAEQFARDIRIKRDVFMENLTRRTWAEIDLEALAHNYRQLRVPGAKYLGVVKANGYGHGAVQVSRKLEELGADYLAVACLDEAIELREAGIKLPILILGNTLPVYADLLVKYDITQAVTFLSDAKELSAAAQAAGKQLKIHIKVDTGMSRMGFQTAGELFESGIAAIAETCALPGLDAEGIFTHFCVADGDEEENIAFTKAQFALFVKTIDALKEKGVTFAIRHCANSSAAARYPETHLDMIRPGISLYGAGPEVERMGLRPVMKVKSKIHAVKEFREEVDIGYGRTYHTDGPARIGVIHMGYADGLLRSLSNKMKMVTAEGEVPVRGRICMDVCMVDLSKTPGVQMGDEVEIFGDKQPVDVLADLIGTVPNELVCAISRRVPRVYVG